MALKWAWRHRHTGMDRTIRRSKPAWRGPSGGASRRGEDHQETPDNPAATTSHGRPSGGASRHGEDHQKEQAPMEGIMETPDNPAATTSHRKRAGRVKLAGGVNAVPRPGRVIQTNRWKMQGVPQLAGLKDIFSSERHRHCLQTVIEIAGVCVNSTPMFVSRASSLVLLAPVVTEAMGKAMAQRLLTASPSSPPSSSHRRISASLHHPTATIAASRPCHPIVAIMLVTRVITPNVDDRTRPCVPAFSDVRSSPLV